MELEHAFKWAVAASNPEAVNLLLQNRADVNGRYNTTPAIFLTIQGNNPRLVKLLIEHRVDVKAAEACSCFLDQL